MPSSKAFAKTFARAFAKAFAQALAKAFANAFARAAYPRLNELPDGVSGRVVPSLLEKLSNSS